MKRNMITFLSIFLFSLLMIIGFSSWIIVGEKSATVATSPISQAICYYIDADGNENKYTRIEKALEDANNEATSSKPLTVYVLPSTNPTIYKDCTIGEYTTLCFPYEGTTYYTATDKNATNFNWGALNDFADKTPDTYRKNRIIVSKDVTITNNGKLQVGGVFGRNDAGSTGIVNGNYCELMLLENAKIISNNSVECYGYIKESYNDNGSILELKAGTLNIPFAVYDFKAGTLTLASYNEDISPFNVYDISNIQTLLRIHSGVEAIAEYRMEMSDKPFSGTLSFIGSQNAGLIIRSGYLDFQYTSDTYESGTSKTVVEGQTVISLYGKMSIGTINISVSGYDMSSADWFFPVSYKLKFIVKEKSELTLPNKAKFMPGSSLIIEKGGVFNINNQIIFYPEKYSEASTAEYYYPDNLTQAKFINNGSVIIGTSGALGIAGSTNVINVTDTTDAIIEVYNTSSVTSNDEVTGSALGIVHDHTQEITGSPYANLTTNNSTSTRTVLGGSIYEGVTLTSGSTAWKEVVISGDPVTIDYYQVVDGSVSSYTGHGNATTGTVDTGLTLSTPSKSGYVFKGWYLDQNGEQLINNGQLSGLALYRKSTDGVLKVYAIFEKGKVVNIKYVDPNGNDISGTKYNFQSTPGGTITLEEDPELIISSDSSSTPNYKTKYTLINWVIDETNYEVGSAFEIPSDAEDGSTITIKMNANAKVYYKLSISGTYKSITFISLDGSSYSSAGDYYVEENTTVEVTINGKFMSTRKCYKNGTEWFSIWGTTQSKTQSFIITEPTTLTTD